MDTAPTQKLTVAFAGNPNVGKSTLFNMLTGLNQHTGNWPGKTVGVATGKVYRDDIEYTLVDLPGTYSLEGKSEDEQIAGEYIRSGTADCTVIVCDGSCLERSLILALQILELAEKAVVCVNLMDEAERHGIEIDKARLEKMLKTPVVLTSAGSGIGLDLLIGKVQQCALQPPPLQLPSWEDPVAWVGSFTQKNCTCSESSWPITCWAQIELISQVEVFRAQGSRIFWPKPTRREDLRFLFL